LKRFRPVRMHSSQNGDRLRRLDVNALLIGVQRTLRAQPDMIHDNRRDDHEYGGVETEDCAENEQDGCDPQGQSVSTDKDSHATITGMCFLARPLAIDAARVIRLRLFWLG